MSTASSSDDCTERRPDGDLRSYGRTRGRRPSAAQTRLLSDVLPKVTLDLRHPFVGEAAALFARPVGAVWLEIGFGGAEHLLWQARQNPHTGLIGCEPYEDGVIKALSAIAAEQIATLRLHAGDARDVLRWLPPGSIDRAFVLFPDPWPKRRQQKRRLVNRHTLALLARVMRPGAQLRVATDIGDYVRSMMIEIAAEGSFRWLATRPADWRERSDDWPATRYEQKARREGRRCYYLRFERGPAGRRI